MRHYTLDTSSKRKYASVLGGVVQVALSLNPSLTPLGLNART